jgi:hypothetical protein
MVLMKNKLIVAFYGNLVEESVDNLFYKQVPVLNR